MTEEYNRYRREQARAWLEHCRGLMRREKAVADLAARELAAADNLKAMDYSRGNVKASLKVDAVERAAVRHMDFAERLEIAAQESAAERADALERISKLPNPTEQAVLIEFYLTSEAPRSEDVARRMNYSERNVRYIRDAALVHVYEHMPHVWRDAVPTAV